MKNFIRALLGLNRPYTYPKPAGEPSRFGPGYRGR